MVIPRSLARRDGVAIAALVIVAALAFYYAEDAAAGTNTCTYDPQTRKVTVTASIDNSQIVVQRQGNQIVLLGGIDCGATRFNTDKIVIQDVPNHDLDAFVVEAEGRLAPGHENEPGGSDEIEIKVNLGNGSNSFDAKAGLGVVDDDFRLGTMNFNAKINLNAEEQTGLDADITITGQWDYVVLESFPGNDRVDLGGGAGTGSRYTGSETYVHAGDGRDVVLGGPGPDNLNGHDQKDRLEGKNGEDNLDGGNGDDFLDGGAADDNCSGGSGANIIINCEAP
jgi:Ca2+-binding RTX toxin-like protein